ncbi:hypothetical protein PN480_17235 [Dolichospermum circinale CS-1225]|uniref:Uncharacterized protein n=1 Tax=Dolichospermum circinale CS-537/01 TaxID=3021739 RepID=A0ABT5A6X2_9CYAN|nr:hypothetical protein [Dolichospermum circinale]MDB9467908.1 hypothetical protein [Dolichospermum circinale CS-539/09]MDB9472494.1 hypothetical protein [Dolichospermum circinale CS-539]MDB9487697.1 hypothetical protein [Dolichospermum circinale CS-537/01]MDB9523675.1 hypothetical protein [Dolichospermum circinale CS-1225]
MVISLPDFLETTLQKSLKQLYLMSEFMENSRKFGVAELGYEIEKSKK